MRLKSLLLTAVVSAQFGMAAFAQETNSSSADIAAWKQEVQALEQKVAALQQQVAAQSSPTQSQQPAQVQDLDQRLRVVERQRELDQQAAADAAKSQPKIMLGANGFSLSSANSNFVASLHGLLQADSRNFFNDGGGTAGKNTFLLRRARPIFTGTVFHDFDFNFTPDFGGTTVQIVDAYMNYRYSPELQLEAGKFKPPVGLEALQAEQFTLFNERSLATDLVPYRDIGAELHGDLFGGGASYAAGIFNGVPDYTSATVNQAPDDNRAFEGRLFFQPWKTSDVDFLQGLGFGVGGSYEVDRHTAADLTSGYKTDGQQSFYTYAPGVVANGTHWRLSPQGYYYYGPLSVMGEYAISDQVVTKTTAPAASADIHSSAWEVSAGWVLTGEDASYNGVTPRHSFDPRNGHWGAWQIVARYADLYIDHNAFPTFATAGSASEAKAWGAGINWYLNRDIRVNASFSRTTFIGGGGTAGQGPITAQPENVFFTRMELAF